MERVRGRQFSRRRHPYGVLDMAGNAWEWLRTLWGSDENTPQFGLPYTETDGRENREAPPPVLRCMRGGAFTVEASRAASTFSMASYQRAGTTRTAFGLSSRRPFETREIAL